MATLRATPPSGGRTGARRVRRTPEAADFLPLPTGPLQGGSFDGTKALLFAVLDDGIRTFFSANSRLRRDAEHWMDDPRARGPFAFRTICDLFLLDPDAVRRELLRMRGDRHAPRLQVRPRGPRARRIG